MLCRVASCSEVGGGGSEGMVVEWSVSLGASGTLTFIRYTVAEDFGEALWMRLSEVVFGG